MRSIDAPSPSFGDGGALGMAFPRGELPKAGSMLGSVVVFDYPAVMSSNAQASPSANLRDAESSAGLFRQVYGDLRRIAGRLMRHERSDHTLSATALVNEAFIRIVASGQQRSCTDDRRLRQMAVRSMRNILIDHARRKMAAKRSGDRKHLPLEAIACPTAERTESLLEFDDLVTVLAVEDPLAAEFAKLRVYGGESVLGAGRTLGLSRWDSYQLWEFISAWFRANADVPQETSHRSPLAEDPSSD